MKAENGRRIKQTNKNKDSKHDTGSGQETDQEPNGRSGDESRGKRAIIITRNERRRNGTE